MEFIRWSVIGMLPSGHTHNRRLAMAVAKKGIKQQWHDGEEMAEALSICEDLVLGLWSHRRHDDDLIILSHWDREECREEILSQWGEANVRSLLEAAQQHGIPPY